MKKFLSVVLSLVLALSFVTCFAYAGNAPMSKTEAFVKSMENGVGVKANLDITKSFSINGELYVKKNRASANVSIGPLNAKAILDNGKFTAYFSIFRANITNLVPASTIRKLTDVVNAVPETFNKLDTDIVFKYLSVSEENTGMKGDKYVESFGPNYEAIADLIVEENRDALNQKDRDDIKAFCEYFAQDNSYIGALLNSKAEFTYTDEKAQTLVAASLTIPNEQNEAVTMDVFDLLLKNSGIKIGYITVDIDEKVFKAPFSLLDIGWIIKLIIKAA